MRHACSKECWEKPSQVEFQRKHCKDTEHVRIWKNTFRNSFEKLCYFCCLSPDCRRFPHMECQVIGQKSVFHYPWWEQKGHLSSCCQKQGVTLELIRERCLSEHPSSLRTTGILYAGVVLSFSHSALFKCHHSRDIVCLIIYVSPWLLRSHLKLAIPSLPHSSINFPPSKSLDGNNGHSLQWIIFLFFLNHVFYIFAISFHHMLPLFLFPHFQATAMFHELGGEDWCYLRVLLLTILLEMICFLFSQWWCVKHLCCKSHCGEFTVF